MAKENWQTFYNIAFALLFHTKLKKNSKIQINIKKTKNSNSSHKNIQKSKNPNTKS